jgi:hypothetical protein
VLVRKKCKNTKHHITKLKIDNMAFSRRRKSRRKLGQAFYLTQDFISSDILCGFYGLLDVSFGLT